MQFFHFHKILKMTWSVISSPHLHLPSRIGVETSVPHNDFSTFPNFSVLEKILLIQFNFIKWYFFFQNFWQHGGFFILEYLGNLTFWHYLFILWWHTYGRQSTEYSLGCQFFPLWRLQEHSLGYYDCQWAPLTLIYLTSPTLGVLKQHYNHDPFSWI